MNRFLLQASLVLTVSFFIAPLYSMECALAEMKQEQEKPLIKAKMYIDNYKVCYALDSYYDCIESNSTISAPKNMPVIPVLVTFKNDSNAKEMYWNEENIPSTLCRFEVQRYKQEMGVTEIPAEEAMELLKTIRKEKKIFDALPVMFVWTAKTGSLLQCNIFGYPIEITCCGNKKITGKFEDDFKKKIDAFIGKPRVFRDIYRIKSSAEECINKKLIANNPNTSQNYVAEWDRDYIHGESSLVNVIQDFLNFSYGKHRSNEAIFFLLSLVQSLGQL